MNLEIRMIEQVGDRMNVLDSIYVDVDVPVGYKCTESMNILCTPKEPKVVYANLYQGGITKSMFLYTSREEAEKTGQSYKSSYIKTIRFVEEFE